MSKPPNRTGRPSRIRQLIEFRASQMVGKYGFTDDDRPDLEQDLPLHFLHRRPQFDRRRSKLITFADRIIRSRIKTFKEYRMDTKVRDYRREAYLIGDTVPEESEERRRRGITRTNLTDRSDLALDVAGVMASLPDDLKDICTHLQSKPIAKVAEEIGIPRSTLYDRLAKLQKIFRKAGLAEYLPFPPGASRPRPVDDSQEQSDE